MKGQSHHGILAPKLQRVLRARMTDAERRMWSLLRGKQMAGCKFRRQHPFERWILDFVCLELRLIVEVDGGQHADAPDDRARDRFFEGAGFTILRFWNHDVLQQGDAVADAIYRTVMQLRATHPHPNPPPEGEGVERCE